MASIVFSTDQQPVIMDEWQGCFVEKLAERNDEFVVSVDVRLHPSRNSRQQGLEMGLMGKLMVLFHGDVA